MNIRKYHRLGAMIMAPLLFMSAVLGFLLLIGHHGLFSEEFIKAIFPFHNMEFLPFHLALLFPIGTLYMVITGTIIAISIYKPKKTK